MGGIRRGRRQHESGSNQRAKSFGLRACLLSTLHLMLGCWSRWKVLDSLKLLSKDWGFLGTGLPVPLEIRWRLRRSTRVAKRLLSRWETEVFEGRFQLPKSAPPTFDQWSQEFLTKVSHPNTRKRYTSSIAKLKMKFAGVRLPDITPEQLEEYKDKRLADGVEPATINHDLRVLRRMLRLAERRRFITRNPFVEVEFLRQRQPRLPHIVTFNEEDTILNVAPSHIRMLVVLILETGMRSHREALSLRWDAIDFAHDLIRIRESKNRAGVRAVPLSTRCKQELLKWRETLGPQEFVFPSPRTPTRPMTDIRGACTRTLDDAKVSRFPIYHLRHSFCSRLSAAGVPDLFVAQMVGHRTTSILPTYSKIDEYRRDVLRKLEVFRMTCSTSANGKPTSIN